LLSVGGIAWQESSSLRLAVVNGISVNEGSAVEGARVDEILPDRVRFSFRNEHFELPLGN
jgi:general secretion pathway protein B